MHFMALSIHCSVQEMAVHLHSAPRNRFPGMSFINRINYRLGDRSRGEEDQSKAQGTKSLLELVRALLLFL